MGRSPPRGGRGARDGWAALVLLGCRMPRLRVGRGRVGLARAAGAFLVVSTAVAVGAMSCAGAGGHGQSAQVRLAARVALRLFASAPVVIVASPDGPGDVAAAVSQSLRAHAPLLLTSGGAGLTASGTGKRAAARTMARIAPAGSSAPGSVVSAVLRDQIKTLDPQAVLAVGVVGSVLAAALPGIRVVTSPAMLPATTAPAPPGHLVLLVHRGDQGAATLAAAASARVAGARVIPVRGADPRADPAAIAALAAAQPRAVLAIGAGFGPTGRLASRISVAETGVQLPGGGQVLFPMRMLVALYGEPGTPSLGVLGHQGLQASIARARRVAAAYRALSHVPVVPAFEIIATVAQAHPG